MQTVHRVYNDAGIDRLYKDFSETTGNCLQIRVKVVDGKVFFCNASVDDFLNNIITLKKVFLVIDHSSFENDIHYHLTVDAIAQLKMVCPNIVLRGEMSKESIETNQLKQINGSLDRSVPLAIRERLDAKERSRGYYQMSFLANERAANFAINAANRGRNTLVGTKYFEVDDIYSPLAQAIVGTINSDKLYIQCTDPKNVDRLVYNLEEENLLPKK